jgi:murein DD-endopeptidase MepM/ murein hydrolase activator NlpD
MLNLIVRIIVVFFVVSCSSMKSGQYVYVETPGHLKKVAKSFGISVDDLKKANPDKNFDTPDWLFVPTKVGIAHLFNDTYVIDDYRSLGTGRFIWPVPDYFKVSSHFGPRNRRHHDGIDIPAPVGSPIVASDDGVVFYSDNGIRGYGNMIVILHGDEIFTVYAHNDKNLVEKGDKVSKGDLIAYVGNTGRSTGPHLHFEIRVKNKVKNPAKYLSKLDLKN